MTATNCVQFFSLFFFFQVKTPLNFFNLALAKNGLLDNQQSTVYVTDVFRLGQLI